MTDTATASSPSPAGNSSKKKQRASRARRPPSEAQVETFLALSLGDVVKFAQGIVARDQEVARFLHARLGQMLPQEQG